MTPSLLANSVARIMLRNGTGRVLPLCRFEIRVIGGWGKAMMSTRSLMVPVSFGPVESQTSKSLLTLSSVEKNFVAFARCLPSNAARIPTPVSIAYPPPKWIQNPAINYRASWCNSSIIDRDCSRRSSA